jgi:hypothetical protein
MPQLLGVSVNRSRLIATLPQVFGVKAAVNGFE